jgi:NADH-quinone oxidoreductase subunit F
LGASLKEIIYDYAGGIPGGKKVKAVIPGGASTPVLTADQLDVTMDFESLAEADSALGPGAIIVLDEDTCMVDVARRTVKFFAHESCGRCTPCRAGSQRALEALERIEDGHGDMGDIDQLHMLCDGIEGRTFCPMGDALVGSLRSILARFANEFEYHVKNGRCATVA